MLCSLCPLRSLQASCHIARLSMWMLWGGMRSTWMPDLGALPELQSGGGGSGSGPGGMGWGWTDRGGNLSPAVRCCVADCLSWPFWAPESTPKRSARMVRSFLQGGELGQAAWLRVQHPVHAREWLPQVGGSLHFLLCQAPSDDLRDIPGAVGGVR